MVTVILDGYNVIHAVPGLARQLDRSLQAAREALVALCQGYRVRRGDIRKFYVVFDGRHTEGFDAHEQPRGGITVVFTQQPEEADQRILRLIEAAHDRCVVVSDDNEVCNNARAFRASILSVQAFYLQAQPASPRRREPLPASEKLTLSTRDAQRITEEYRKHLEGRARKPG